MFFTPLLSQTDQVTHYNGTIREKPESEAEARAYLKSYETAPACTVSSVVITDLATGTQVDGVDIARQWFKPIPTEVRRLFTCLSRKHPTVDRLAAQNCARTHTHTLESS